VNVDVGSTHSFVIAGLDPAIQRAERIMNGLMDARVKPAHDDLILRRPT
jgi:hypothetical protein